MNADEFWELPDRPDIRLELVDGEVVEVQGKSMLQASIIGCIFTIIHAFARQHKLGRAFVGGPSYLLLSDPDTLRIPDVSFIPRERMPEGRPTTTYMTVPPGLVVEVVSPSNSALELRRRTRDYLAAGVDVVWVVWPEEQSVSVYLGSMTPLELTADDTLDGGDLLPGFSAKVAELFNIDW